jgi:hypothetical protein
MILFWESFLKKPWSGVLGQNRPLDPDSVYHYTATRVRFYQSTALSAPKRSRNEKAAKNADVVRLYRQGERARESTTERRNSRTAPIERLGHTQ